MPRKKVVTIAEFSIHPIGRGTSVSPYVRAAIDSFSQIRGLKFQVTPMATILEAQDLKTILSAVEQGHHAVRSLGAMRISSFLRIDQRFDKPRTMSDKVKKVRG